MSQFAINLLFVGGSFAIYIGIAIWSRAASTKEFYVAGGGVHPSSTVWLPQPTGCQPHRLSLWPV